MKPRTSPVRIARYKGEGSPHLTVLMTSLVIIEVSITTVKISPRAANAPVWCTGSTGRVGRRTSLGEAGEPEDGSGIILPRLLARELLRDSLASRTQCVLLVIGRSAPHGPV